MNSYQNRGRVGSLKPAELLQVAQRLLAVRGGTSAGPSAYQPGSPKHCSFGARPGDGLHFYRASEVSRTIQNNATMPASNTPLSSPTEMECSRANPASKGFPAAVASIDPIRTRNTAILGLTATCEITVKIIITTRHKAAGATSAVKLRIRKTRTNKITTPQTIPIQCIRPSEYPTIAPAWSRLASTENAPGATTKLKNTSLPSQMPNPSPLYS